MSNRVLVHSKDKKIKAAKAKPAKLVTVGTSGAVTVHVDPALGAIGQQLAVGVQASAPADYSRVAALFALPSAPPITIAIDQISDDSDGSGGAWHLTCADTVLHCDASFGDARRTSALWIAEFVEVLSNVQGQGWDCGNTNGEALSRFLAEWAYPGVIDDYSTASIWLDGERANYVESQQGTDTDPASNGCGTLFLWWLVSLGYTVAQIAQSPADNLAETYEALTGESNAWERFSEVCEEKWPVGQPSELTTDNPWPAPTTPPTEPTEPTEPTKPAPSGATITFSADLVAGEYALVPVAQLKAALGKAKLSPADLMLLMQQILQLLTALFGGKSSPAAGPSSSAVSSSAAQPAAALKAPAAKK